MQIYNIHSNFQEVNNFPARNSSGNSVFSEWEDDENDADQLRNYAKYKNIIKTNTLNFKTIISPVRSIKKPNRAEL